MGLTLTQSRIGWIYPIVRAVCLVVAVETPILSRSCIVDGCAGYAIFRSDGIAFTNQLLGVTTRSAAEHIGNDSARLVWYRKL